MNVRENRLYFIGSRDRIKIGITVDVKRRMAEIGKHVGNAIELLGHVAGSYGFEKHLHSLLADHALGHEWFRDCDTVREIMRRVLDGDDLGFVPEDALAPPVSTYELTPELWLARFNAFAKMVFPEDTDNRLAAFLEISPEQARSYLLGDEELPDLLWSAFSAHVVGWVLAEHAKQKSMRNVKVVPRR